uniref:Uncharacterized protein n=1 Tax=Hemiselmis andersenii TaxID=464988 RepID=A0A7S1E5V4_HEMAN|mmetsp:Transcript_36948/g.89698  ORF Transcript_36948/g.89698 Transcript_36948/m.89698 type:complete len:102 (+) Transcript_36948:170-475(+)
MPTLKGAILGAVGGLVAPLYPERTQARSLHAIANLVGDDNLCIAMLRVPDLYASLNEIRTQGFTGEEPPNEESEEHLRRALARMSQVRYGTLTWREPQRMR